METIGQRIKRLRLDRGYRQLEFDPLVSMTQSSLSNVESKNKEFSAAQLLALSNVLRVSPHYIMFGGVEDDMSFFELSRIYQELPVEQRQTLVALAQALVPKKINAKAA